MKIANFFILLLAIHLESFAKVKNKIAEQKQTTQHDTVQKAIILVLDKLYTNRNFYEIEISNSIMISSMEITILDCINNNKGENFMLMRIRENGDDILNEWIPIAEYITTPTPHKRFAVTPISCNFYKSK